MVFIPEDGALRLRERYWLVQHHPARKWQCQDLILGCDVKAHTFAISLLPDAATCGLDQSGPSFRVTLHMGN